MSLGVKGALVGLPAVLVAVTALSGCSSSDAQQSPTSEPTATDVSYDWDLAFAKCMREQGVDFADPKPGGGVTQTQIDDQAAYDKATEKCSSQVTAARGKRPVSADERKNLDHYNDVYAEQVDCLRKKGYDVEVSDGGFHTDDDILQTDVESCKSSDDDSKTTETGR